MTFHVFQELLTIRIPYENAPIGSLFCSNHSNNLKVMIMIQKEVIPAFAPFLNADYFSVSNGCRIIANRNEDFQLVHTKPLWSIFLKPTIQAKENAP
ncbi:hypothetical protein ACTXT7_008220 [Hymenolepis weldensis]